MLTNAESMLARWTLMAHLAEPASPASSCTAVRELLLCVRHKAAIEIEHVCGGTRRNAQRRREIMADDQGRWEIVGVVRFLKKRGKNRRRRRRRIWSKMAIWKKRRDEQNEETAQCTSPRWKWKRVTFIKSKKKDAYRASRSIPRRDRLTLSPPSFSSFSFFFFFPPINRTHAFLSTRIC